MTYNCDICGLKFSRRDSLKRHIQCIHSTTTYKCKNCNRYFSNERKLKYHQTKYHSARTSPIQVAADINTANGINSAEDNYNVNNDLDYIIWFTPIVGCIFCKICYTYIENIEISQHLNSTGHRGMRYLIQQYHAILNQQ